jgi:hypothetical protein
MLPGKDSDAALEGLQTSAAYFAVWRKDCRPAVEGDTLGVFRLFVAEPVYRTDVFASKHCINRRKTTEVIYALNLSEQSYKML